MSKTQAAPKVQGTPRINFSAKGKIETPDFLDIQIQSFKEFFQLDTLPEERQKESLYKTFQKIFQLQIPETNSYWSFWIIL